MEGGRERHEQSKIHCQLYVELLESIQNMAFKKGVEE